MALGGPLLSGLVGSPHCAAMCGGFAASCSDRPRSLAAWHLGRMTGYAALGALAGAAGDLLPGPPWFPAVVAALFLTWFALGLAGIVPEASLRPPPFLLRAGVRMARSPGMGAGARFVFGLANGFLPCGLVYAALTVPVALARPLPGAVAMLAFGLGTAPALTLAALGLRRIGLATLARRRLFALLVFAAGLGTIWHRVSLAGGESVGRFLLHCLPTGPR